MRRKKMNKKLNLSNLSSDGPRRERASLAMKNSKKPFDRKSYNDKYSKKVKANKDFYLGWFKGDYVNDEKR
jgi:hypothetical protein